MWKGQFLSGETASWHKSQWKGWKGQLPPGETVLGITEVLQRLFLPGCWESFLGEPDNGAVVSAVAVVAAVEVTVGSSSG